MSKIAFIAPNKRIYVQGKKVIGDLGLNKKIKTFLGRHRRGVDIARRLEAEGYDVIVTRGGTAEQIMQSGIKMPVVEVPVTGQDLAQTLYEAKKLTGLQRPRLAVMAFKNMIYDIESLSKVFDIEMAIYRLNRVEDIPRMVRRVVKDKVDVLLGGIITTRIARQYGVKTLFIMSGEASFRHAFLEAEKLAYARKIEKERVQAFMVLVDCSVEGIISVDSNGRINVFNPSAERLLNCPLSRAIGRDIEELFPEFAVAGCLTAGQGVAGRIVSIGNRTVLANIAPIRVSGSITGAMVTFQDVSRIQEMEAKIRQEVYTKGLAARYSFQDIAGVSREMQEAKRIAGEFAQIDATVLILGATGTGKELFAQSIHNASARRRGPFVAVNCAAIPPNLLESELFGYVEGAFTGANRRGKPGLFELAHGGTIFLDEISEMDKYGQSRLLRVVQERQVMRLGDDKYIPIDVRIVAATNKNLRQLVHSGSFRDDLYYRLNVLTVHLPLLKERCGDVEALGRDFLRVYNRAFHKDVQMEAQAWQCLAGYEWPGNVRELRNFMEKLVIMARGGRITAGMIRSMLDSREFAAGEDAAVEHPLPATERERLLAALAETGFNQKEAARLLGMNRSTLYRKLKRYQIEISKSCYQ